LLLGCHDDRHESFYPALADAQKDGATDRGWVPDDLLPGSVHSIHEVHDLSPSVEWCAFEFASEDSKKLRSGLKAINTLPGPLHRVPNPHVKWWPTVLTGKLDMGAVQGRGFELFTVERVETSISKDIYLFAIDWQRERGYFYVTDEWCWLRA
jgi:hypothetical protein